MVSTPSLKRDPHHHIPLWELRYPCFSLISAEGGFSFFLVAKQRQKLATENNMNKLSLSAVLHWVAHSGGLCCSDSLCLHDYWKVSLLRRANRITLSCSDPCSSSYTNLLVNYTVIASRHPIKIWHRQGWSWEKKSHLTAGKQCSWISVHCYTLPSRFINNPSYKVMIIFFLVQFLQQWDPVSTQLVCLSSRYFKSFNYYYSYCKYGQFYMGSLFSWCNLLTLKDQYTSYSNAMCSFCCVTLHLTPDVMQKTMKV